MGKMHHIRVMRTTVTLPEEVAEFVDLYADAQGVSRSRAVADLILRCMPRKSRIRIVDGVPLLDIPDNGKKTSYEDVKRIESEGY
jgi:CopG-like RHH_1 or ribbon-helix-helix domain, RHH_5